MLPPDLTIGATYEFAGDETLLTLQDVSIEGALKFRHDELEGVSVVTVALPTFRALLEDGIWRRVALPKEPT